MLQPPPGYGQSEAIGLSKGGHYVVGNAQAGPLGATMRAVRWGPGGTVQIMGPFPGVSISRDGQVATGVNYRWTQAGGLMALQLPPATGSIGIKAVNADGSLIVGHTRHEDIDKPCYWVGTAVTMLTPPPGYGAFFTGVGATSNVIVGTVQRTSDSATFPFRYTGGGYQIMASPGNTNAVSLNGNVLVGHTQANPARAWRVVGTVSQDLGTLPGAVAALARAVSEDGSIVVGESGSPSPGPFVWRAETGMLRLSDYAQSLGVNLTGWTLHTALGVSADDCQMVICGSGTINGVLRGFILELGTGPDADGDSICDNWETGGIPYADSQGVERRYILDSDGDGLTDASPMRKDVFVEIDAMDGRNPSVAGLARVVAAFDTAPVTAPPGGLPGIKLHLVRDEMALPLRPYPSPFTEFQQDKAVYFGTPGERADSANWALKQAAKAKAYRYCIFADQVLGQSFSGIAEGIGCNDFIVSLGAFTDGLGNPGGTEDEQVGTFMHELGHAMGLRHGGADDTGFKPNYYSVMNYLWQMPNDSFNPGGPLGTWEAAFSDRVSPPLLESALSESAGIGDTFVPLRFPFTVSGGTGFCPSPINTCTHWGSNSAGDPVDWNCNGVIDPQLVAVNINTGFDTSNNPSGQLLTGHDDWSNLIYNFRNSPHFANGAPPVSIGQELTLEMHQFLSSLPDRDRAFCSSDFNGDGDFGTDADIEAFFACLGGNCCPACYLLGADFNGDGDVGTDADIEAFFRVLAGGNC